MRNVTYYLYKQLSKKHNVLPLDVNTISLSWFKKMKNFDPKIIHYTHGPSIIGLIVMRALAFCSNAKTVMSATQPRFSHITRRFIPLFKPNLILTQSCGADGMFKDLGCVTEFLPNGVDVDRFVPVSKTIKERLRKKYGVDNDTFVIAHVGSIRSRRNIQIFGMIQEIEGIQVVIAGSTSMPMEQISYKHLLESGCMIWRSYFENIEEIYQLSDCYIFPATNPLSAIELPLSVLEAMSCNLPVISTKFGALPKILEEGGGLLLVDDEEDVIDALKKVKNTDVNIETREQVLPYAWDKIVRRLESIYEELISEGT
jgi:glycosyltransferase involved in cell wall biosynthesis